MTCNENDSGDVDAPDVHGDICWFVLIMLLFLMATVLFSGKSI